MAEWARLLSECRGNLVAGSNPALPATRNTPKYRACFFVISGRASPSKALGGVPAAEDGDGSKQYLFETQLHAEMRAFESQPFIKPVRIFA